jgi:hypothetical protein
MLRAYRATVARFPDWGAVMLFYAALHFLEQAFEAEGRHNLTHGERELYIKQRHEQAWVPYSRLLNESKKARYLQGGGFSMNARAVDRELRRSRLRALRRYVRTLIGGLRA